MVAILTTVLMTAAEISNLFSAVGVVICFVCMVVFIMRVQGDVFGTSVVHVAQPPVARMTYQKVDVPFSVRLHKAQEASFTDVQIKVCSQVNYALRSFWGVPSEQLHMLLTAPWTGFFLHLMEEPAVGAQVVDEILREDVTESAESVQHISLAPDAPRLSLGPSPRRNYPLVVCLTRCDTSQETNDSRVGALITIIHIKDAECRVPTCILHQYLKQYSGQLTKLEALYTQNSTSDAQESTRSEENTGEDEEEDIPIEEACVVCQSKRTTRALLPCRHVCVCDACCSRLDNCPMCRTRILAYFLVAPEDSASTEEGHLGRDGEGMDPPSAWHRFSGAVNRMMGIEGDQ
ncbi:Cell growth regulator with RING finger domain protein 1 [Chionoecetes opilio]|uniref:Cell growth regulator with RING finger domain protein 1 n=1 Tax=Chionoecetes opilio TaxID=41210 RepID=A0A8J4Y6G3_CHIOP|nr:Cell growth regulator with RING finger domain protein 1 [Chionoecetes opilio]